MTTPGPIILLGSGETSPNARKAYQWLFEQIEAPINAAILETPAGFEPNSDYVAAQIADNFAHRLQNFDPHITIIPARKKNTAYSPNDPDIIAPMFQANIIFTGPGSPTYAARQLQNSLAWYTLLARHRMGAALIFASAATLAISTEVLPVYEIYKVGEELHWKKGLDFFGPFGLNLVFIPHWNNREGGQKIDTSRCYVGQARYQSLKNLLPAKRIVVGIEENTALAIKPAQQSCQVMGLGDVYIFHGDKEHCFENGAVFSLGELGPFTLPDVQADIPAESWAQIEQGLSAAEQTQEREARPSKAVMSLLEQRSQARQARNWAKADQLRDEIEAQGWKVLDTPDGSELVSA